MNKDNNISQEQLERIERYLDGSMTDQERSKFEAELQQNPDFKQQVEDVQNLIIGVESAVLKDELDQFHDDLVPVRSLDHSGEQSTIKLKRFRKIVRYVSAAVIILGFTGYLIVTSGSSSEKLFAKHFAPDPGLPTTMSNSSNFEFYDAMVNYKQGDYDRALKKWEALYNSNQNNDTLIYFIGVTHLADGREQEAIQILEDLSIAGQNSFENETNYYLGMAHLKANNVEEAKKYLTFSGTDRANQVLSELNK